MVGASIAHDIIVEIVANQRIGVARAFQILNAEERVPFRLTAGTPSGRKIDGNASSGARINGGVDAVATKQLVEALAAFQFVVSVISIKNVVASLATQVVTFGAAEQVVIAGASKERVGSAEAKESVVSAEALNSVVLVCDAVGLVDPIGVICSGDICHEELFLEFGGLVGVSVRACACVLHESALRGTDRGQRDLFRLDVEIVDGQGVVAVQLNGKVGLLVAIDVELDDGVGAFRDGAEIALVT